MALVNLAAAAPLAYKLKTSGAYRDGTAPWLLEICIFASTAETYGADNAPYIDTDDLVPGSIDRVVNPANTRAPNFARHLREIQLGIRIHRGADNRDFYGYRGCVQLMLRFGRRTDSKTACTIMENDSCLS